MHASLRKFIKTHCVTSPTARVALVDFWRAYDQTLAKSAVVAELTAGGFIIAKGDDGRLHVGGLALAGRWQAVDGQLEFKPGRLAVPQAE